MLETSFRIHRDEVTRTLICCPPTAERQKIGFDPIATERQLRRNSTQQVETATAQRILFSRKQRNSYGADVILIDVTATAKRQRQNINGMLETRHYCTQAVDVLISTKIKVQRIIADRTAVKPCQ